MDAAMLPDSPEARKRGGRPRKRRHERRGRVIQFRVTDEEAADLEARAGRAGMSPGTFARAASRTATVRVVASGAPDRALASQVRRLGITADQSLKAMRGGYYSPDLGAAAAEAYREAAALLRRLYHGPEC
jgi:hypothetical protein